MVNENLEKRRLMENANPNWAGFVKCLGLPSNFDLPPECLTTDQSKCMTKILEKVPEMSSNVDLTKIQPCAQSNNVKVDINSINDVLKTIPGAKEITDKISNTLSNLGLPGFSPVMK